jgi:hypothetical protein
LPLLAIAAIVIVAQVAGAQTFAALKTTSVTQAAPTLQDNAAVLVNIDSFLRAETDYNFQKKVDQVGFGQIGHLRQPPSIDNQPVG